MEEAADEIVPTSEVHVEDNLFVKPAGKDAIINNNFANQSNFKSKPAH